jgi:hypothetical protein
MNRHPLRPCGQTGKRKIMCGESDHRARSLHLDSCASNRLPTQGSVTNKAECISDLM